MPAAKKSSETEDLPAEIAALEIELKKERAAALEADNARRTGDLVSLDRVKGVVARISSRVRHDLDSLPIVVAADIAAMTDPGAVKTRLAAGIADCLRHYDGLVLNKETVGAKRTYAKG